MPLGPCPLLHVADEGAPLSPIRVLASFLSLLHQAVCKHTHHCSKDLDSGSTQVKGGPMGPSFRL